MSGLIHLFDSIMRLPKLTTSFLSNLFTISFGTYILASLASQSTGILGQWISSVLNLMLGQAAYLVPLLILVLMLKEWWVQKYFSQYPVSKQWTRWVGGVLLICALAALASLQSQGGMINGGVIGFWLQQLLTSWIGLVGALLVINFLVFLALGLCFDFSWGNLLEYTGFTLIKRFEQYLPKTIVQWVRIASSHKSSDSGTAVDDTDTVIVNAPSFSAHTPASDAPKTNNIQGTPLTERKRERIQLPSDKNFNSSKPSATQLVGAKIADQAVTPNKSDDEHIDAVQQLTPIEPEEGDFTQETDISRAPVEAPSKAVIDLVKSPPLISKETVTYSKSLPSIELLRKKTQYEKGYTNEELAHMGELLQMSLKHFNIEVEIEAVQPGPVITLFEVQPAPGVKVSQISALAKDLARAMAIQSVRVVEVIKGKSVIGLEIPNKEREMVNFKEVVSSKAFQTSESATTMVLGKDSAGGPMVVNLEKMPHLLVAGTTGSGKSVGVNGMIISMLYKALPEDLKFIMIDPKMLELSIYEGIPHLLTPVVTDVSNAANALKWSVAEMERRYKLMSLLGVRNIRGLNEKINNAKKAGNPIKDPLYKPQAAYGHELSDSLPELEPMSFIVIVIDEFADLMMVVGKQVEELIARLAQKARAAGIHLILATQRPSVNVITGLIKANIPTRLSFQVSTKIDSRTILDQGGAEQLLGMGDLLYLSPGSGMPIRAHGAFVSDEEVHSVVDFVKKAHEPPSYINNLSEETEQLGGVPGLPGEKRDADQEVDELYDQAVEVVLRTKKSSISRIQREFRIGYNRAARLIEDMEKDGILSGVNSNGQREILQAEPSSNLD